MRDAAKLPLPPHSPEAEDALIGSMLSNPEAMEWATGIEVDDFYDPVCREAFRAMTILASRSEAIDVVTVFEQMRTTDETAGQGLLGALNTMGKWNVSRYQVRSYARILRDRSRMRSLIEVGWKTVELGYERDADAAKQVDAAQMLLAKLSVSKSRHEPRLIEHSMVEYLDLLQALSEGKNPALSTGIGGLDKILNGGLRRGEVFVLGARPKHGKTALALAMARGLARHFWVLYLSQEMPVTQLMHRHTAALGTVDIGAILRADPADREMWKGVIESAERMRGLKLFHDDECALTLLDVRRKVMSVRRSHGVDVLMVDFLQLMAGAGEENRNRELDVLVNGLKALALELDMAVVILSQMSRKAEEHYSPPTMTHLRDSGAIEAAADQIALLFTDHAHPMSPKEGDFLGYSQLEIAAHRNGPTGIVPLEFVGKYQQIGDWMRDIPQRRQKSSTSARSSAADF